MRPIEMVCSHLCIEEGAYWTANNEETYRVKSNTLMRLSEGTFIEATDNEYKSFLKGKIRPYGMPQYKELYFVPDINDDDFLSNSYSWLNDSTDRRRWKNGLVFTNEADARNVSIEIIKALKQYKEER